MFKGYAKVEEGDEWVCSPVISGSTKRKLVMRVKVWLFNNSFDNQTPFVIMVKPEEGGTYECIVNNNDAQRELMDETNPDRG